MPHRDFSKLLQTCRRIISWSPAESSLHRIAGDIIVSVGDGHELPALSIQKIIARHIQRMELLLHEGMAHADLVILLSLSQKIVASD